MRDLGDFQTPPALVAAILDRLGPVGARWPRVLEPTWVHDQPLPWLCS